MILTPLESAALAAICEACAVANGPVLTSKIDFAEGYSRFAGAMSSLRRKGLVTCEGERQHRGTIAAQSKRTVVPTPDGFAEYAKEIRAQLPPVEMIPLEVAASFVAGILEAGKILSGATNSIKLHGSEFDDLIERTKTELREMAKDYR